MTEEKSKINYHLLDIYTHLSGSENLEQDWLADAVINEFQSLSWNESVETESINVVNKIPTEELYRSNIIPETDLHTTLRFIKDCICFVEEAKIHLETNPEYSDDRIHFLWLKLHNILEMGSVNEGLRMCVNALICGIENRTVPIEFNKEQLISISTFLNKLSNEPFLNSSKSVAYIEQLEQSGLNVLPFGFEELTNFLSE